MHLRAQAAITASGAPPMPSRMSTPVPARAAISAPATSPSVMNLIRAPASRTSRTSPSWRGRLRITTVTSLTGIPLAWATATRFSATVWRRSTAAAASGPTASFSM